MKGARDYTYSEDHEDDLDEPVFAPGANVLGSMNLGGGFSMTNMSFSTSSVGADDKIVFGPIDAEAVKADIHTT